jgi:DNA-binding response OmpR family regulator
MAEFKSTILIVDDEVLLRKQLTAQLERLGMDVTGASTLSVARQLLSETSFDFARLTDSETESSSVNYARSILTSPVRP